MGWVPEASIGRGLRVTARGWSGVGGREPLPRRGGRGRGKRGEGWGASAEVLRYVAILSRCST